MASQSPSPSPSTSPPAALMSAPLLSQTGSVSLPPTLSGTSTSTSTSTSNSTSTSTSTSNSNSTSTSASSINSSSSSHSSSKSSSPSSLPPPLSKPVQPPPPPRLLKSTPAKNAANRSIPTTRPILLTTFLLALISFVYLDARHRQRYAPTFRTVAHSPVTNISLVVSGVCRPVVYCGVDTRASLLRDYDASALPLDPDAYSASQMNWARILLLQVVLAKCPASAGTQWVVYSDTDAYVPSRSILASRLRRIPSRYTFAFQNGRWLVNSGVHAWRTDSFDNNVDHPQLDVDTSNTRAQITAKFSAATSSQPKSPALQLLKEWEALYKPNSQDFFAEQNALDAVYRKHRRPPVALHFPNGHLAWHMKGKIPFKVELSAIARRFAAASGPALFQTVLLMTTFIALVIVLVPTPTSFQVSSSAILPTATKATTSAKKDHHDQHCVQHHSPVQYQASSLYLFVYRPLLLVRTAYFTLYRAVTSRFACTMFVSFVFVIVFMLAPTGRRKSAVELSKWDYHHLLPHGRVMLKHKSRVWADAFGHLQGRGVRWRFYRRHTQSAWKVFTVFTLAEVIEWSGLLWIYPLIVVTRVVKWADVKQAVSARIHG